MHELAKTIACKSFDANINKIPKFH